MIRLLVVTACVAFLASAQSPATPPAFEVASVKPSKLTGEGRSREATQISPGSVVLRNVSLRTAITWAYKVQAYQVTGPAWIAEERYDIEAKAATAAPEAQLRLMLQTLLADRFKLMLHRQQKEMDVLAGVVAKGGLKMKPAENPDAPFSIAPGRGPAFVAKSISMEDAASMLSGVLPMPVVDMTGVAGRFDVTLDMTPYIADVRKEQTPDVDAIIDILNRVAQQELGLKLEHRKAPVDLLVVDGVERAPTEN